MLIVYALLFIGSILALLFEYVELAVGLNFLGFITSVIILIRPLKKLFHFNNKSEIANKVDGNQDSTKIALNALKQKQPHLINLKILKKEKNPYIEELKSLSEAMQKQQNRIQKRTRKLHEKNSQNIQLLSIISHEIKNPLSIIQASIETLQKPNNHITPSMQENLLHRILFYTKKISALLNKLTLSESLEHNVITVDMKKFEIISLCEEVIEGFRSYLLKVAYKNKEVVLEGLSREVIADRILLEQVLNNLIHNALKYANHKVIVSVQQAYIEIIDDGNGIDSKELKLITKRFYRGRESKHNARSLGLGLFIVQEIAKIHHTEVQFYNRRNKKEGLCVRFVI